MPASSHIWGLNASLETEWKCQPSCTVVCSSKDYNNSDISSLANNLYQGLYYTERIEEKGRKGDEGIIYSQREKE